MTQRYRIFFAGLAILGCIQLAESQENSQDVSRLVAAMLGETPLYSDLQSLTDEIGGRATGSEANMRSVEWALARFRDAGLDVRKEAFQMPALWLGRSVSLKVHGDAQFDPVAVAMPYSASTGPGGITAPLVYGARGVESDFTTLSGAAKGAFVLIETEELADLDGLFREYREAVGIEQRAFAAGVCGIIYMSSRPHGLLYRHNASRGRKNTHPMVIMEREEAMRAIRLLKEGKRLMVTVLIENKSAGPYESYNVIAEIRGTVSPEEFLVIGAHLDSWDLGTGALDNGCNVAMVIDLARQMKKLGLRPRRTIRFALWNGEEQGLFGSQGYTISHADELDRHVMASSYDIGSGRITGFFTGGRPEILKAVEQALKPIEGLGPFVNVDIPIVGTDNYDFMMEGIGNLVANQESANYGPNYHARSDTYDKVDLRQLKLNGAIAAAVTWGFANMDISWGRQTSAEIEGLIKSTDLGEQMKSFGMWEDWENGTRGRKK
jgi:Iap family predicted aminopeptidase